MAKVRSATLIPKIALAASLIGALACPVPAAAQPRVTIALLPSGTGVEELGAVARLSPGLLSAGLGEVAAEQTYLDITQGNRVFDSLYDSDLPPLVAAASPTAAEWEAILARSRSAPAEIELGLLATSLARGGARTEVDLSGSAVGVALLGADRGGIVTGASPSCRDRACAPALLIREATVERLPDLVGALRDGDLLLAVESPPPSQNEQLAIGIAGAGFDGTLTSDSTRLEGYVLSTDVAPTILDRLGIDRPDEISGEEIRAGGEPDAAAVAELGDRLSAIPERRGPVIGLSVLLWLAALALVWAATRGRLAPVAARVLALSVVYLPLTLLLGAALQPGEGVERLIVGVGAPTLAGLTLAALPGYRGLATACVLTTLAYSFDVLAGSPLTSLSLIGPNPGLGVRFYGIGNELEATLAPLILVGAGSALCAFAPRASARRCVAAFLAAGVVFGLLFAAGRFGADVGAAIVFPAGAAVAAAVVSGRRRMALLALATPLLALAALALVDLVSGGDAHLTRSVLDAGGLGELADVAERRLRLSAKSFGRAATSPFLPLTILVIAVALRNRERVRRWLSVNTSLRAGFIGAAAAIAVGALVNDSGALLLEIGSGYLLVLCGFAWAESGSGRRTSV